jgi:hypothetical protein
MKKVRVLVITLLCALTLVASSTTMASPQKRGYASCCKMKNRCYLNKRCCTDKHTNGLGCYCKKGSCPMPHESMGMTTDKWVVPVNHR